MGVIVYSPLHMSRYFHLKSKEIGRPVEWIIKRLIKVRAKVACHGRKAAGACCLGPFPVVRRYEVYSADVIAIRID